MEEPMSTLILPAFDLLVPRSLTEAVGYLARYGKDAAVLAGGTDLLVSMKAGLKWPYVLSLAEIPDLASVQFDPAKGLSIGAMATISQVVESAAVKRHYPALWQSAAQNGTPQTRNTATVVGNIMRASPSGDCCCAILAHGATLVLQGPAGTREVNIDDFWLDYMKTARQPDELAVAVILPPPPKEARSAFLALNRTSQDLSKLSAAVALTIDGTTCRAARLAMGAVAPTPLRMRRTEELLTGVSLTDATLEKVAAAARAEVTPIDDIRSTAAYRRTVSGTLMKRAIKQALTGAGPAH
jgi:carbon-monoxide dehydrogenase medium subunit